MKDRHGFYQGEQGDTLPSPGAKTRAERHQKGREMRSTNDGGKRTVIYVRVASAENSSQQQAERQEAACREVARRLGFEVVGVYRDIGGMKRPALRRMLGELEHIRPSYVMTVDPSRFGRRVSENLAVRATLATAGVTSVFVRGSGRGALAWSWPSLKSVLESNAPKGGVR